jgi:hypothetical protein
VSKKRDGVSPSLRWSVFARDGFTCRYCGAQAGQDGVELHADHVVSIVEGGGNTYDNLVTACQCCNGGKGARSLENAPAPSEVVQRLNDRAKSLRDQAKAIAACITAEEDARDEAVCLKCHAYRNEDARFQDGEVSRILTLCREFGADEVLKWYQTAADRRVPEWKAILYVNGIARKVREELQFIDEGIAATRDR